MISGILFVTAGFCVLMVLLQGLIAAGLSASGKVNKVKLSMFYPWLAFAFAVAAVVFKYQF